ncbi:hypothetical protein ACFPC0_11140 [Streptomyces andamanensis]|uniref:Uncharacterized protein n=1 Tax=Streptomyces andamanensis TaxID=1565035 RepID=A0ABV8TCY4_9ACTN
MTNVSDTVLLTWRARPMARWAATAARSGRWPARWPGNAVLLMIRSAPHLPDLRG